MDAIGGILKVMTRDVKRRGITLGVNVIEERKEFEDWKTRVIKIS